MGNNRDLVLQQCRPAIEPGFSQAEYDQRLASIRARMAEEKIDLLWLTAPKSLCIAEILKPGLTVGELVLAGRAYYDEAGIWSDAGWVGGYELGIGFPPDRVGNFVYEMSDSDSERVFEPRTCVNFESQFFGPRLSGITYYICTLLFKEETAEPPVKAPRELVVID
jgi:hypothetical protein